jgi:hypothetical protein
MISGSRHLIKNIVKRPYWTPSNTNSKTQGFIDYEKYVQDTATTKEQITEIKKEVNDIHMYYKHLTNSNMEQGRDLKKNLCNVSALNQHINDQKYWIFHSVVLSYIGLFTYIFKL